MHDVWEYSFWCLSIHKLSHLKVDRELLSFMRFNYHPIHFINDECVLAAAADKHGWINIKEDKGGPGILMWFWVFSSSGGLGKKVYWGSFTGKLKKKFVHFDDLISLYYSEKCYRKGKKKIHVH